MKMPGGAAFALCVLLGVYGVDATECISSASIIIRQDHNPWAHFFPPVVTKVQFDLDEALPLGGSIQLQLNDDVPHAFQNISDLITYTALAKHGPYQLITLNDTSSIGGANPSVSINGLSTISAGDQVTWNVVNILSAYPTLPSGTDSLGNFRLFTYDATGTEICSSASITPTISIDLDRDPDLAPAKLLPGAGEGGTPVPDGPATTCENVPNDLARTAKWVGWTHTNGHCGNIGYGACGSCNNDPAFVTGPDCKIGTQCEIYGKVQVTQGGNTRDITVTYHGDAAQGGAALSDPTNYCNPTTPYTSACLTNPPRCDGSETRIIKLTHCTKKKVSFSEPVVGLLLAFVSLNNNGWFLSNDFDILSDASQGGGYWGGGASWKVPQPDNDGDGKPDAWALYGNGEPHGVIEFKNALQEFTWKSMGNENWNGFTIGFRSDLDSWINDPDLAALGGYDLTVLGAPPAPGEFSSINTGRTVDP
jgi:hypothetical protein